MNPDPDLYALLEVSPLASQAVIKAAYRCLAQLNHPDKHAGNPLAIERQARINAAYTILSRPDKRHEYDRRLAIQVKSTGERREPGSITEARVPHTHVGTRPFAFRPLA